MKNIENFDESDREVKRTMVGDTLILEERVNKESREVEEYSLIDDETKEIMEFVDIKALENSEYFLDWIKARCINNKSNPSEDEVKKIANKLIEDVTDIIMNSRKSSRFRVGRRHRGCIHDAGDFIGLVCRTGQTGTRVAELGIRTGLDDAVFPYWNFFVSGLEK